MMTRSRLAELSRALEDRLVLSVYVARENEDFGKGREWLKRLEVALGDVRSSIDGRARSELRAFDGAAERVRSTIDTFGRILPAEGWYAFADEEQLVHSGSLPYRPRELVRWTAGPVLAPFMRALKVGRPAIVALVSSVDAALYRYEGGELTGPEEVHAGGAEAEAADIGVSKRASTATGVRGTTRADYVKRARDENVRKHQRGIEETLAERAGDDAFVILGGTQKAISAVNRDLVAELDGRVAEAPDLALDTKREELIARVADAVSLLTEERQTDLLEQCADPHQGSSGWNETYRALAAGAVDTLLLSRGMIERVPDDAERLVRLAIAQGAELEEVGGALGEQLTQEADGVAAKLRFVPASLQA